MDQSMRLFDQCDVQEAIVITIFPDDDDFDKIEREDQPHNRLYSCMNVGAGSHIKK